MILVTGGCRSGKSEFAENLTKEGGSRFLYMATAKITDEAMAERVRRHQDRRSAAWDVHEGYVNLEDVLRKNAGKYDGILLDSASTMVTNLLFDIIGDADWDSFDFSAVDYKAAEEKISEYFKEFISAAASCGTKLVVVTDEIGLGVIPETYLGRAFRDILGRTNQLLAAAAQDVWFVVSGIPVAVKRNGSIAGGAQA